MIRAALALVAFAAPLATAAVAVSDDSGREVVLERPAQRIASLAPFLTELAFSAHAGSRLVAVSAHSDYPPQARALPQVAAASTVSLEALLAERPDLVLAWRDGTRPEDVERLRAFGIPVFVAVAHRLEDAPRLLEAIARLAGTDAAAAARDYRESIERLRAAHRTAAPVAVFLEIWHQPLQTLAGAHWMNEALEVCGASNAFAGLPGVAPLVSWEDVYARDPPVVVGAGSAGSEADFRAGWKERTSLRAVREGRLVYVDPDLLQRPTLRLAQGVARLCEGLDRVRPR